VVLFIKLDLTRQKSKEYAYTNALSRFVSHFTVVRVESDQFYIFYSTLVGYIAG
jgi:hypothetical protein